MEDQITFRMHHFGQKLRPKLTLNIQMVQQLSIGDIFVFVAPIQI